MIIVGQHVRPLHKREELNVALNVPCGQVLGIKLIVCRTFNESQQLNAILCLADSFPPSHSLEDLFQGRLAVVQDKDEEFFVANLPIHDRLEMTLILVKVHININLVLFFLEDPSGHGPIVLFTSFSYLALFSRRILEVQL